MSAQPNDGGPAFPHATDVTRAMDGTWETHTPNPGMTLRDYFAAKAMAGMLSSGDFDLPRLSREEKADAFAKLVFIVADAMIEARDACGHGNPRSECTACKQNAKAREEQP